MSDATGAPCRGAPAPPVDLLVVGGGVNGCGIARDAAGRGLSVLLVEAGDLAGGTSATSTKLVHGGLRYLEHGEFRLVREALMERERLLRAAPHVIWPLRFVLPHDPGLRPAWMVRLGLLLYDHLAPRAALPASRTLRLDRHPFGAPLRAGTRVGFAYSDCWVEDSRLVVLNAMDARERGATIATRTRLVSARRAGARWEAALEDATTGARRQVAARAVVNAAGPWVSEVLGGMGRKVGAAKRVRLVKGSHLVVRRHYEGDQAYVFQQPDRRVVFAIPYEGDYTLIGTTDVPFEGDPRGVTISAEETDYLLAAANRCFREPVTPAEVVWSYSGVRPLHDDGALSASVTTRDYAFDLDAPPRLAPALSVFGGKITTYRRLAEHALDALRPHLPGMRGAWTDGATLPGGDIPGGDAEAFARDLAAEHPFLAPGVARRLVRAYGTRAARVLGAAARAADLGRSFGRGLTEAELAYLADQEWAVSAEDVLWRRSKLGLHLGPGATAPIDAALAALRAGAAVPAGGAGEARGAA